MNEIYCGPAPDPASLFYAWRFDGAAVLLVGALAGHRIWRDGRADKPFVIGSLFLLVLFMSPLCAASAALFSARVTHHLVLVTVAAPLLVYRAPLLQNRRSPFLSTIIFTILFWAWHIPHLYDIAVHSPAIYWFMQTSLLLSACYMWSTILRAQDKTHALFALLSGTIQMGMIGALLTFAGTPLYGTHLFTTSAFGLSALEDQQLSGLVMWVPGAVPFLIAALAIIAQLISPQARLHKANQR